MSVKKSGDSPVWIENLSKKANQEIIIGKKIKCINPNHKDKDPSMHIYENHAYCFGCGYVYPSKQNNRLNPGGVFLISEYLPNVEAFHKVNPFFYDKNRIFWIWNWNKYCYEQIDETSLMILIDDKLKFRGNTITSAIKNNYLEAFKRVGRKNIPKDPDKNWIQFGSFVTIINKKNNWGNKGFEASPDYLFTNPIPWDIGKSVDTPVMDKLFKEWVGEEYINTLYEIIAYCCYSSYPIHLAFCLIGSGRNGKSKFQQLLSKFIGNDNCSSTELDTLLNNRFESFKLYKKLVCQLGETNFGVMSKTSLLKKLTGGDLIGFEKKLKDPFDDYNYAKIIINSNSLPTSDDTSEGFYRRWLIINFPNEFPEGKDILELIPEEEYNNLARKCIFKINKIIERGYFTNQGTIEERRRNYIMASNPLPFFIEKCCERSFDAFLLYQDLFNAYKEYLVKNKKRVVQKKEFVSGLENEGIFMRKSHKKVGLDYVSGWFFEGIKLKDNWRKNLCDNCDNCDKVSISPIGSFHKVKNQSQLSQREQSYISLSVEDQKISLKRIIPEFWMCDGCNHSSQVNFVAKSGQRFCKTCAADENIFEIMEE